MRGVEGLTVADWVNDTLTGDATLQGLVGTRVYGDLGPANATYPFIVFTVGETHQVNGVGLSEIFTTVPLTVKAVGKGSSYGPLYPIVARLVELLAGKTNQVASMGLVITAERTGGIQFPEQLNGIEYRHLGAQFEINAQ